MSFSRRTLSLATIVIILGILSAGVWWRLGGQDADGEGADAAAQGEAAPNLMPRILGAVEAGATVGEICARLQSVFGRHEAQAFL